MRKRSLSSTDNTAFWNLQAVDFLIEEGSSAISIASTQVQLKSNKLHFTLGARDLPAGCRCGWDVDGRKPENKEKAEN